MAEGEVVVVTGASAGVGRATIRAFARAGASVGLIARATEGLENGRREVLEAGCRAIAVPADVADADQVEAAAEKIESELGPIDIWVNNAMTTIFSRFMDVEPDDYKRATEVTYLGTVWDTMAALKRMYPRNQGTIVQVGSALVYRSIPLQAPYCGAKHAIAGFTDSVRTELIHEKKNIHICMVQLPAMNTPQFNWCKTNLPRHPQPVPPIYQPEVAAEAIVYAAHHRRRQIYVGWPTVQAIWGNKFTPQLLDRFLASSGYDSQQTDQPVSANRPNNLFEAVAGDAGAHGIFGDRASNNSLETWATLNKGWLSLAGMAMGALALGAILRPR